MRNPWAEACDLTRGCCRSRRRIGRWAFSARLLTRRPPGPSGRDARPALAGRQHRPVRLVCMVRSTNPFRRFDRSPEAGPERAGLHPLAIASRLGLREDPCRDTLALPRRGSWGRGPEISCHQDRRPALRGDNLSSDGPQERTGDRRPSGSLAVLTGQNINLQHLGDDLFGLSALPCHRSIRPKWTSDHHRGSFLQVRQNELSLRYFRTLLTVSYKIAPTTANIRT